LVKILVSDFSLRSIESIIACLRHERTYISVARANYHLTRTGRHGKQN